MPFVSLEFRAAKFCIEKSHGKHNSCCICPYLIKEFKELKEQTLARAKSRVGHWGEHHMYKPLIRKAFRDGYMKGIEDEEDYELELEDQEEERWKEWEYANSMDL